MMTAFFIITLGSIFIVIGIYIWTEYRNKKEMQESKEKEALEREKERLDWLEGIRELYKKKKSKITPGDIRPVDFAFSKDDVESVYFTKTMSAAK